MRICQGADCNDKKCATNCAFSTERHSTQALTYRVDKAPKLRLGGCVVTHTAVVCRAVRCPEHGKREVQHSRRRAGEPAIKLQVTVTLSSRTSARVAADVQASASEQHCSDTLLQHTAPTHCSLYYQACAARLVATAPMVATTPYSLSLTRRSRWQQLV